MITFNRKFLKSSLLILAVFLLTDLDASEGGPSLQEFIETRQEMKVSHNRYSTAASKASELSEGLASYDYDVKYYELDLDIDPERKYVTGRMKMHFDYRSDDLERLRLDLHGSMAIDSIRGSLTSWRREINLIVIEADSASLNAGKGQIEIFYRGTPRDAGFGSFGFAELQNGSDIIWSLSEPFYARDWWPCKDIPSDKADSARISIRVPDPLFAVSNGVLEETVPHVDRSRTYRWFEKYPITTYLISVAITDYRVIRDYFRYTEDDSMELTFWAYPENIDEAKEMMRGTLDMLKFFSGIYCQYPFIDEKYGIAQFPRGGGMEHQTVSSQSHFGEILTVHELAHQWFGDMITNDNWHEIWLNEGFASYSEALYFEYRYGEDYYREYMQMMDRPFTYPLWVDDTTNVWRIFENTVYDKGAWFLHMLRYIVGDEDFFEILRSYSEDERFKYKNAGTDGFQDVCESVSGMDLDYFFDSWMFHKGRPNYRISWTRKKNEYGGHDVTLRVRQMQTVNNIIFPMPLEFRMETAAVDSIQRVFNDQADQIYEFTSPLPVNSITFDPNMGILKNIDAFTYSAIIESEAGDYEPARNYPNPFNTSTEIVFTAGSPGPVNLTVYSLRGKKVAILIDNEFLDAGVYRTRWDGEDFAGRECASGIYLYRLNFNKPEQNFSRKMLLIR